MATLFDQLIAEQEAGIERLIDERTLETVSLDFKTKRDPTRGRFDDEDKKVFGKAVSAFANSNGGLLIWGVDARPGPDKIDCAQPPGRPIAEIERFQAEAIRLSGDLLMPRHEGIRIERIATRQDPSAGYLLVEVERSERRPHRSEAREDKRYYRRAGDSSFVMEHGDLEDQFKRFTTAKLELDLRCSKRLADGSGRILQGGLEIALLNTSQVSAKMPYLQTRNIYGAGSPLPSANVLHTAEGVWTSYSGDTSVVIHPGLTRTLATFTIDFDWSGPGCKLEGIDQYLWGFHADVRFGCENVAATQATIEIDSGQLMRMLYVRSAI